MLNLLNIFSLKRLPFLSQFHILLFYVLLFHVLSFGPSISRPSFSRPEFSAPPTICITPLCRLIDRKIYCFFVFFAAGYCRKKISDCSNKTALPDSGEHVINELKPNGWVTICSQVNNVGMYQTSWANSAFHPSGVC